MLKKKFRIFDSYGVLQQDVLGRFHGLVEGENGDIFTLKVSIEQHVLIHSY